MLFSEEINTFLAVVRSGSLLQAAEIASTTLLPRSRGARGISLTAEGERVLDIAERWKMLEIEAEQLQGNQVRHLAVGSVDAVAINALAPFITALCDETPPVRLHMESSRYFQLANRVASGHLDVAFTLTPSEHVDLVSRKLRDYAMLVVYAASGKTSLPEALDMTDLDPTREIHLPWSPQFDLWRIRRGFSRHVNWVEKAHMLAPMLRNAAWAIVPSFLTAPLAKETGCTIHRIAVDPPEPLSLFMISRKQSSDATRRHEQLIEMALAALD